MAPAGARPVNQTPLAAQAIPAAPAAAAGRAPQIPEEWEDCEEKFRFVITRVQPRGDGVLNVFGRHHRGGKETLIYEWMEVLDVNEYGVKPGAAECFEH